MVQSWKVVTIGHQRWLSSYQHIRRLSSSACTAAPLKIGTLPFVGRSREELEVLGGKLYREAVKKQGSLFGHLLDLLRGSNIQRRLRLRSLRPVFLPYYLVNFKVVNRVESAIAGARMYTFADSYPIPAHNESDMHLIEVGFPSPKYTTYQSLDVERHTRGELAGQAPEILPFRYTPTTVVKAGATKGLDALFEPLPQLKISTDPFKLELERISRSIATGKDQIESGQVMRIDKSLQSVEYMSSSPISMPFYIAEYTNSSVFSLGQKRHMTVAIPGWKAGKLALGDVSYHWGLSTKGYQSSDDAATSSSGQSQVTWTRNKPMQDSHLTVFFVPRVPIASNTQGKIDAINKRRKDRKDFAVQAAEWLTKDDYQRKNRAWVNLVYDTLDWFDKKLSENLVKELTPVIREAKRRDLVEVAYITLELQKRIKAFLAQALLKTSLPKRQEGEYKNLLHSGSNVSSDSPEREAGMGDFINWGDLLLTAPSGCDGKSDYGDHREYFVQDMRVQQERINIFDWERTTDEGRVFFYGNIKRTAKTVINEQVKKRAELKPESVKKWLSTLPTELYRGPDRMRVLEMEDGKPKAKPKKPAAQTNEKNTVAGAGVIMELKPQYKTEFAKMKLAMEEKLKRSREQIEVAAARKAEKVRIEEETRQKEIELAKEREEQRLRKVNEDNLERAKRRKIREEAAEKERKERLAKERELEARQRKEERIKLDKERIPGMVKPQRTGSSPVSTQNPTSSKQDKVKEIKAELLRNKERDARKMSLELVRLERAELIQENRKKERSEMLLNLALQKAARRVVKERKWSLTQRGVPVNS